MINVTSTSCRLEPARPVVVNAIAECITQICPVDILLESENEVQSDSSDWASQDPQLEEALKGWGVRIEGYVSPYHRRRGMEISGHNPSQMFFDLLVKMVYRAFGCIFSTVSRKIT